MIKRYYDTDCNMGMLDGKTVAVIGFGSQGHAHSQNLKDSGANVVVGLRKDSKSWKTAEESGLKVMEVEDAAKAGDLVMMAAREGTGTVPAGGSDTLSRGV